jgi:peptidoglycan hydrolase CwlO-like protein
MNIVLFLILAVYALIKISKDVIRWITDFSDRKNKKIHDDMYRCNNESERITRLEEQYKSNEKSITQILSQIQEINQKLDTLGGRYD